MSFDLPERSPLATLSIIDLSSSQVTRPRGHARSWLLWPCSKHPPAQRGEGEGQSGTSRCVLHGAAWGVAGEATASTSPFFGFWKYKHPSWSSPAAERCCRLAAELG